MIGPTVNQTEEVPDNVCSWQCPFNKYLHRRLHEMSKTTITTQIHHQRQQSTSVTEQKKLTSKGEECKDCRTVQHSISKNNIGQGPRALGSRVLVFVYDLPFLVVYFFGFFVAEEENHSAEEENGCTPSDAVSPSEFPNRSVAFVQLGHEAHWIHD